MSVLPISGVGEEGEDGAGKAYADGAGMLMLLDDCQRALQHHLVLACSELLLIVFCWFGKPNLVANPNQKSAHLVAQGVRRGFADFGVLGADCHGGSLASVHSSLLCIWLWFVSWLWL